MPTVTLTLTDTPTGGVSIHSTYTPAIGAPCSAAQSAALEILTRTRKQWAPAPLVATAPAVDALAAQPGVPSIEQRVIEIIAERLAIRRSAIKPESRLLEDLHADSLDGVTLLIDIEEEFGIDVNDDDVQNIKTVGQWVDYVTTETSKKVTA